MATETTISRPAPFVEDIGKSVFNKMHNKPILYFSWGNHEESVFNSHSDFNCLFIPVGSLRASISEYYHPKSLELKDSESMI